LSTPRIGFVSLGCPKATVDSERILTELRADGYAIASDYGGSDLVIVNTCGFIDAAVDESLDAIAEALDANGRVIVTGCLGARAGLIREAHPEVLAVTGPQAFAEVMAAVHQHLPPPPATTPAARRAPGRSTGTEVHGPRSGSPRRTTPI
jgi:ribosomal protein S12 methylthiotransferase